MMTHNRNILLNMFLCATLGLSLVTSVSAYEPPAKGATRVDAMMISGKVTESRDVSGYTYVEVDTGKQKVWAAGPVTKLKVGDKVSFSSGMPVENYHSKTLERDFTLIYFVGGFYGENDKQMGSDADMASPHGGMKQKPVAKVIEGIDKVKGGYTIAEIYKKKKTLESKKVRVRGKVTKFSPEIMGKNWLHIMDSSGLEDLTLTSTGVAKVGDIVVVEGKVAVEKDYGYGYVYPIVLEETKIIK